MIWTAIVEDTETGVIQTPVFNGSWSCKPALSFALDNYTTSTARVVCVIKGGHSQTVYPSADNVECDAPSIRGLFTNP